MLRKTLLVCGILSSLLYGAMIGAIGSEGYSRISQTPSELTAIGAPTRSLWMLLGAVYTVLVTAFGWGVWKSAGRDRALRIVGGLLVAYGSLGLLWPFAPMHQREVLAAGGGTLSDTMHVVLASATVLLMFVAMGFAASSIRETLPPVLHRKHRRPRRVRRVDLLGCAPRPGQSAHAVDRVVGAHQHQRVPAVGRGARDRAVAARREGGGDRPRRTRRHGLVWTARSVVGSSQCATRLSTTSRAATSWAARAVRITMAR